ncbi:MAG TPA: hypothetical protein VHA52_04670 [Candidatus Babeliaceae bacterium]|nr:hypothetical protein [Candidatus Babeliaceae bacterium]
MVSKVFEFFNSGDCNPINLTDWQKKYAETFGNKPSFLIAIKTIDVAGNNIEKDAEDVLIQRYYSDWPYNTKLERITFKINDGSVLENDLTITIKP